MQIDSHRLIARDRDLKRAFFTGRMFLPLFVAYILGFSTLPAQISITLNNSFIEKYKNRVSIDAKFTVDKAHEHPNSPSKDGDLHIAGRSSEVKLPIVAEIMNAGFENDAVQTIHDHEGTANQVGLKGAWRLWCEH